MARKLSELPFSSLLGGSFAGYYSEFSGKDGEIIAIPARFVPEELLLWGQAPKCWEVLVEEDADESDTFARKTTAVLPAVGCGLDSLDTIVTNQRFRWDKTNKANADNPIHKFCQNKCGTIQILDSLCHISDTGTRTLCLETIFDLPSEHHRLRVLVNIIVIRTQTNQYKYKLCTSTPIRTYWERRYDFLARTDGDLGVLASNVWNDRNGHLDAGTVFGLIGKDLRDWEKDFSTTIPNSRDEDKDGVIVFQLPKNLVITFGPTNGEIGSNLENGWYLEVRLGKGDTVECKSARREFHSFDYVGTMHPE